MGSLEGLESATFDLLYIELHWKVWSLNIEALIRSRDFCGRVFGKLAIANCPVCHRALFGLFNAIDY